MMRPLSEYLWPLWCRLAGHKSEEQLTATICRRCRRVLLNRPRVAFPVRR